jgi:hypothetical protein
VVSIDGSNPSRSDNRPPERACESGNVGAGSRAVACLWLWHLKTQPETADASRDDVDDNSLSLTFSMRGFGGVCPLLKSMDVLSGLAWSCKGLRKAGE